MKVLWFSPTPSLGEGYLSNKPMNGGFIKSLEKEIQGKVELSVAFYNNKELLPFKYGETTYYPIKSADNNFFYKLKKQFFHEVEPKSDLNNFLQIIEKVKPDVIHIHGTERPFGLIQEYISVPTVISIQGNITVYKIKFFSGISMLDVFRYSSLKSWLFFNTYFNQYRRFSKQAKREEKIFKLTKNFIGRTYWDNRICKVLSSKYRYFHNNEILSEDFYNEVWKNNPNIVLYLFTTNGPNIYKGIESLLYCANLLDLKKIDYVWSIAGLNKDADIVSIARKSIKRELSDNIRFLGEQSSQQIKQNILACHIYISVSHIENSPNSLCEALLLGAPSIATNAGGTSNFIEDGINGILIQDGDPYAMAGAIIELKENYDRAVEYGLNAREKALCRHDKKIIADDLLKIYEEVLKHTIL